MAIGVVLALMGTTCLIQLANIQLVNGKGGTQARRKPYHHRDVEGSTRQDHGCQWRDSRAKRRTLHHRGNPEQAQAFIPTAPPKQTGSNCPQINSKPVA